LPNISVKLQKSEEMIRVHAGK